MYNHKKNIYVFFFWGGGDSRKGHTVPLPPSPPNKYTNKQKATLFVSGTTRQTDTDTDTDRYRHRHRHRHCGKSRGALGGSVEPPFGSLISMKNTDLNVYFCSKVPFRESTNPRSNPPSQNPGSAPETHCLQHLQVYMYMYYV